MRCPDPKPALLLMILFSHCVAERTVAQTVGSRHLVLLGSTASRALGEEAARILKSGSPEEKKALARKVGSSRDPAGAFATVVQALTRLDEARSDARRIRDKHGKQLFSVYKKHYGNNANASPSTKIRKQYQAMKDRSKELNLALEEIETVVSAFVGAGRSLCAKAGKSGASTAIAEEIGRALTDSSSSTCRTLFLDSLSDRSAFELKATLVSTASPGKSKIERDERLAAIRCMQRCPADTWLDSAAALAGDPDPYVRRAVYDLAAEVGSSKALGLLVSRLGEETGVPAREIVDHLVHLTGREKMGRLPQRWQDWWESAKDRWRPAKRNEKSPSQPRPDWRYFGLALDSKRVVFVVDTSLSMERGVEYRRGMRGTANLGEAKIEIARRELDKAIDSLADDATFNLIIYKTTFKTFSKELVPAKSANRKRAKSWFRKQKPSGNTNISGPLIEAISMTRAGRRPEDGKIADTIVFMSDGHPTCGPIKYENDILAEMRRLNPFGQVVVHTIYLGHEGKVDFMRQLAEETGGQFIHHR